MSLTFWLTSVPSYARRSRKSNKSKKLSRRMLWNHKTGFVKMHFQGPNKSKEPLEGLRRVPRSGQNSDVCPRRCAKEFWKNFERSLAMSTLSGQACLDRPLWMMRSEDEHCEVWSLKLEAGSRKLEFWIWNPNHQKSRRETRRLGG